MLPQKQPDLIPSSSGKQCLLWRWQWLCRRISGDKWVSQELCQVSVNHKCPCRTRTRSQSPFSLEKSLLTHAALAALSATWAYSPEPQTVEISAWLLWFTPCQTSGDMGINCKATFVTDNESQDFTTGFSIFWYPQKHQKIPRHDTELWFCSAAETWFLPKFCLLSFPSFEQEQLPRNRGKLPVAFLTPAYLASTIP